MRVEPSVVTACRATMCGHGGPGGEMGEDSDLVEHYGGGGLLGAIEAGLSELGKSPATATVDDLAPVDEFHIGGRSATVELSARLEVDSQTRLLDVGCGIGGTSRFFASTTGCQVTGIDLSPTYVEVARTLTEWTGLGHRVGFEAGSALGLPFEEDSFDRAVQLHVGMNIADKAALFAEIARVLRPGGRLGVYDVVRQGEGEIVFPVPWASDRSQSFVADAEEYRSALEGAGFEVSVRDRRQFALEFFETQARRAVESSGPPPVGLHLIIGADTPLKLGNLRGAITEGILAPVEFIATLP
jgi:SAM-dependent methyltransferase